MRALIGSLAVLAALAAPAWAGGGCYICGNGSAPVCRDYCAYKGPDTFDNRHRCEAKGCHITGTSACPSNGAVKICLAPEPKGPSTVLALQCR